MKAKYKMTGCARFAIFLIILAPIAYFGSKYLRDSGTWDKFKDKVESRESNSVEEAIKDKSGDDILRDIERGSTASQDNRTTQSSAERSQEEENARIIREQEQRIQELERQNQDLQNQRSQVDTRSQTPPPAPTQRDQPSRTNQRSGTNTSAPNGAPSLDDLLREADQNVGTTPSTSTGRDNSNLGGAKRTLKTWSFSFQNISGDIEFYDQDGRMFARTVYRGTNRVDISELIRQDDKFIVRNSPTGEYYVLRRDGDLDAYDESGYQTTCRQQE